MARPKKNGTYLNVCIETPLYERLEALCEDAGQTKTVAVERALALYLEDYEEKQRKLKELENRGIRESVLSGLPGELSLTEELVRGCCPDCQWQEICLAVCREKDGQRE